MFIGGCEHEMLSPTSDVSRGSFRYSQLFALFMEFVRSISVKFHSGYYLAQYKVGERDHQSVVDTVLNFLNCATTISCIFI